MVGTSKKGKGRQKAVIYKITQNNTKIHKITLFILLII
jgi:hypothetical protein